MGFGAIAVLAMIGFFAAFVVFAIYMQKKTVAAMKVLAAELGYEFVSGASPRTDGSAFLADLAESFSGWRIEGSEGGSRVRIYTVSRGSGKSRTTFTIVEMALPSRTRGRFSVAREGVFSKIGKAVFKTQDIQIGDEAFDKAVMVKGDDEEAIRSLLSSSTLRDAILRAIQAYPLLRVVEDAVHFECQGVFKDAAFYRPVLQAMGDIARALA